ncbi:MAG: NAD(P)-dependent dehydrogenase (short-subunit alcohol dehydrogenase family) [Gammaproteobacteria bacterium]|jgi:NAD(P)-dependent dehydrogenase (short-subunit alcohol dehydrogenase family)
MSNETNVVDGGLAIVTGAARGIGAAIAQALSDAGYALAIWDFNGDGAASTAAELSAAGRRAISAQVDVADETQVEAAVQQAQAAFGTPCLLVNNAGIRHREPLETLARASWEREIATNLTGPFVCTQIVGRRMLAAGAGAIVNIASMAGTYAQAMRGAYSPSKAGIIALTGLTAVEWGGRGIRCNAISPGMISTPAHAEAYGNDVLRTAREAMIPLGRIGGGNDIADVVVFLASDAARYINGANIPVDGGVTNALIALMPMPTANGDIDTTLGQLALRK